LKRIETFIHRWKKRTLLEKDINNANEVLGQADSEKPGETTRVSAKGKKFFIGEGKNEAEHDSQH